VKNDTRDADGRRQMARYMIRPPGAGEDAVCRGQRHDDLPVQDARDPKRNFQALPGAKWLQLLIQLIPTSMNPRSVTTEPTATGIGPR